MQGDEEQPGKKRRGKPVTEILKNVLKDMNLPEDEVKWAQEALEEHMRKDTNFNHAKCRRYMGLMKQLLKAKVITDLGSVSPDQVVKRGPIEMEVNRRVDLPAEYTVLI